METLSDRFASVRAKSRARHAQQFRFSLLIGLLVGVLLWQTQWLALRPGLVILLAGQIAVAAAYFYGSKSSPAGSESREQMLRWFAREEQFVSITALAESLVRIAGFALLAYGFWNSTHILWITLVLGVAYPVISYFGVARRNTARVLRMLEQQRRDLSAAGAS